MTPERLAASSDSPKPPSPAAAASPASPLSGDGRRYRRSLPDGRRGAPARPPLSVFVSDKVDASTYAYKRGRQPDGPAMLVSYGLTMVLAAIGGKDRARDVPWVPVALAAKAASDVGTALLLAKEEWATNKKLCAYCQAATVASVATLALALPEAKKAVEHLLK